MCILKKFVGLGIGGAFFVFGLMRVGVAGLLLGQLGGLFEMAALLEPIEDTAKFLGLHNVDALFPLTPASYFAVLLIMGLSLSIGAIGALRRARWGYGLIVLYLAMHGALFINFQTVNPKIFVLLGTVLLFGALVWANRRA